MSNHPTVAHHFEDLQQQKESATLGMWAFLITEVMFFGGLFTAYAVYRWKFPEAWAEGSHELDIGLGALNTAILIGSSLTVVLAIHACQSGKERHVVRWLWATIGLGLAFLGVKAIEYSHKFHVHHVPGRDFAREDFAHEGIELFFGLYFAMTGMHAVHMIIGIGLFGVLIRMALKGRFTRENHAWLEMCGLYWHFVDIVWIFLFPLLYLLGRNS